MNTSNYDPKTKDSDYNNDTTFSNKRFGELVKEINKLKNNFNNNCNYNCDDIYEKVYEYTITENDIFGDDSTTILVPIISENIKGVYKDIIVSIENTSGLPDLDLVYTLALNEDIESLGSCYGYAEGAYDGDNNDELNSIKTVSAISEIRSSIIQTSFWVDHIRTYEEDYPAYSHTETIYPFILEQSVAHIIFKAKISNYASENSFPSNTKLIVYARKKTKNTVTLENNLLSYFSVADLTQLGFEQQ